MLDYRIETFVKLCETMNYREAAEQLNITQPAVTQHIQYLEREYNCKLFTYEKRKLQMTHAARLLLEYAISMKYNEDSVKRKLGNNETRELRIGVTKTIGDYVIGDMVKDFLRCEDNTVTLIVENTEYLLKLLEENKLDFALVEGSFDKSKYDYRLYKKEPFIGICAATHRFAGREVSLGELFEENIIYREEGSGTRAILEHKLLEYNESIKHFRRQICISSFKMIVELVKDNFGVSFVYEVIARANEDIACFNIKGERIVREFNFVFLKNTDAEHKIEAFLRGGKSDVYSSNI